jgi:hypothetical protein
MIIINENDVVSRRREKMGDYIFIRIRKSNGQVRITDEQDNDLGTLDSSKGVSITGLQGFDHAFWYRVNPSCCVWQGGRIVCG